MPVWLKLLIWLAVVTVGGIIETAMDKQFGTTLRGWKGITRDFVYHSVGALSFYCLWNI